MKKISLFLLLIAVSFGLQAQNDTNEAAVVMISADPDSAFSQARELAYDGDYQTSRKVLDLLLLDDPGNYQYRLFKARTYMWDEKHDNARNLIRNLIVEDTSAFEPYSMRVLNERYAKSYPICIMYCEDGIKRFPDKNEMFYVNKAQALVSSNDPREAFNTVEEALVKYPDNNELKQLKTFLLNQLIVDGLVVGGTIDYFTEGYNPWYFGYLQYGRQTKIGAIIGRLNYGDRNQNFTSFGIQGEVDIYPRLSRKSYGYVNLGYSPSQIFPSFRFGMEYYTMIGDSKFEGSVGIRYLDFLINQVTMYTGSIGYYWGNEYASFRPFFIADQYGFGATFNFLYRKFFSGKGDFLQLTTGYGLVPDERILSVAGALTTDENVRLDNSYFGVAYQKLANPKLYTRVDIILTRQENFSVQNDYIGIITLGLAIGYRL